MRHLLCLAGYAALAIAALCAILIVIPSQFAF